MGNLNFIFRRIVLKKICALTILLIFCLLITSCTKNKIEKSDYYSKALAAQEFGNIDEMRNYILLYMLNYDESKASTRDNAVVLYTSLDFPATLNTLVLKSSDCMEGRITLYKSYAKLGQINAANEILESRIHGYLPAADYAKLVVNYPTDQVYTLSVFKQWIQSVREEDKIQFLDLFIKFISGDLSEKTAKSCLEIAETLMQDEYYKSNNIQFANLYKAMAILLDKLYDNYNSSRYWKMVNILNPDDTEAQNK